MLFYPEFSLWCGTVETADWHTRYNAVCSVYGHLHIPGQRVRRRPVRGSVGYPRSGGVANPIGGFVKFCRTRTTRPATSMNSEGIS